MHLKLVASSSKLTVKTKKKQWLMAFITEYENNLRLYKIYWYRNVSEKVGFEFQNFLE